MQKLGDIMSGPNSSSSLTTQTSGSFPPSPSSPSRNNSTSSLSGNSTTPSPSSHSRASSTDSIANETLGWYQRAKNGVYSAAKKAINNRATIYVAKKVINHEWSARTAFSLISRFDSEASDKTQDNLNTLYDNDTFVKCIKSFVPLIMKAVEQKKLPELNTAKNGLVKDPRFSNHIESVLFTTLARISAKAKEVRKVDDESPVTLAEIAAYLVDRIYEEYRFARVSIEEAEKSGDKTLIRNSIGQIFDHLFNELFPEGGAELNLKFGLGPVLLSLGKDWLIDYYYDFMFTQKEIAKQNQPNAFDPFLKSTSGLLIDNIIKTLRTRIETTGKPEEQPATQTSTSSSSSPSSTQMVRELSLTVETIEFETKIEYERKEESEQKRGEELSSTTSELSLSSIQEEEAPQEEFNLEQFLSQVAVDFVVNFYDSTNGRKEQDIKEDAARAADPFISHWRSPEVMQLLTNTIHILGAGTDPKIFNLWENVSHVASLVLMMNLQRISGTTDQSIQNALPKILFLVGDFYEKNCIHLKDLLERRENVTPEEGSKIFEGLVLKILQEAQTDATFPKSFKLATQNLPGLLWKGCTYLINQNPQLLDLLVPVQKSEAAVVEAPDHMGGLVVDTLLDQSQATLQSPAFQTLIDLFIETEVTKLVPEGKRAEYQGVISALVKQGVQYFTNNKDGKLSQFVRGSLENLGLDFISKNPSILHWLNASPEEVQRKKADLAATPNGPAAIAINDYIVNLVMEQSEAALQDPAVVIPMINQLLDAQLPGSIPPNRRDRFKRAIVNLVTQEIHHFNGHRDGKLYQFVKNSLTILGLEFFENISSEAINGRSNADITEGNQGWSPYMLLSACLRDLKQFTEGNPNIRDDNDFLPLANSLMHTLRLDHLSKLDAFGMRQQIPIQLAKQLFSTYELMQQTRESQAATELPLAESLDEQLLTLKDRLARLQGNAVDVVQERARLQAAIAARKQVISNRDNVAPALKAAQQIEEACQGVAAPLITQFTEEFLATYFPTHNTAGLIDQSLSLHLSPQDQDWLNFEITSLTAEVGVNHRQVWQFGQEMIGIFLPKFLVTVLTSTDRYTQRQAGTITLEPPVDVQNANLNMDQPAPQPKSRNTILADIISRASTFALKIIQEEKKRLDDIQVMRDAVASQQELVQRMKLQQFPQNTVSMEEYVLKSRESELRAAETAFATEKTQTALNELIGEDPCSPEHPFSDLPIPDSLKRKLWTKWGPELIGGLINDFYKELHPTDPRVSIEGLREVHAYGDQNLTTVYNHSERVCELTGKIATDAPTHLIKQKDVIAESVYGLIQEYARRVPEDNQSAQSFKAYLTNDKGTVVAFISRIIEAVGLQGARYKDYIADPNNPDIVDLRSPEVIGFWDAVGSLTNDSLLHVILRLSVTMKAIDELDKSKDKSVLAETLTYKILPMFVLHNRAVFQATQRAGQSQPHQVNAQTMLQYYNDVLQASPGRLLELHEALTPPANFPGGEKAWKMEKLFQPLSKELLKLLDLQESDLPNGKITKQWLEKFMPIIVANVWEQIGNPANINKSIIAINGSLEDICDNIVRKASQLGELPPPDAPEAEAGAVLAPRADEIWEEFLGEMNRVLPLLVKAIMNIPTIDGEGRLYGLPAATLQRSVDSSLKDWPLLKILQKSFEATTKNLKQDIFMLPSPFPAQNAVENAQLAADVLESNQRREALLAVEKTKDVVVKATVGYFAGLRKSLFDSIYLPLCRLADAICCGHSSAVKDILRGILDLLFAIVRIPFLPFYALGKALLGILAPRIMRDSVLPNLQTNINDNFQIQATFVLLKILNERLDEVRRQQFGLNEIQDNRAVQNDFIQAVAQGPLNEAQGPAEQFMTEEEEDKLKQAAANA